MSIIYTFIRYLYLKEYTYISYSIMQVFSLLYLVSYSPFFDISKFYQDLFLLFATFSAVLFSFTFYEGNFFPKISNTKELIINTLLLNVVILSSFYHYVLFEYIPYTVIFSILFISIIFNLRDGFKSTFIYVIGWAVFCFLLFAFDFKQFYTNKGYIDIVLLAFAIEAILFTISVSYKYKILQNQTKNYEDILLQQSKLVKSGEMISNITHQFRQPLNNISYILINIKKRFDSNKLEKEYFYKKITQANEQLKFLSKTIDDFKEFYIPSKLKEDFCIKDAIDNSLTVLSADMKRKKIDFIYTFNVNEDIKINGIKNELAQIVLSIISNAIDALNTIENPKISLEVDATDAEVLLKIHNNGKQISTNNLKKIFKPYFSTKKEGSGIGLYLVKLIIEKSFEGKIEVENKKVGVLFTLFFERTI